MRTHNVNGIFCFKGNDPNKVGHYHPFYITDSAEGGFGQKNDVEQKKQRVFAGIVTDSEGYPFPTTGNYYYYYCSGLSIIRNSKDQARISIYQSFRFGEGSNYREKKRKQFQSKQINKFYYRSIKNKNRLSTLLI